MASATSHSAVRRSVLPICFLFLLIAYASAESSGIGKAKPSLPFYQDGEVICQGEIHYPDVFHATEDFQPVREGQALPPGLHVRMSLETGEKLARLNVPFRSDRRESGTALIPLEEEPLPVQPEETPSLLEQSGRDPPPYSNTGRISPPKDPSVSTPFETSVSQILAVTDVIDSNAVLRSLEDLEDLAHELYFGLEIASRPDLVQKLLALMEVSTDPQIRSLAAVAMGSALQNNPAAQAAIREDEPVLSDKLMSLIEAEAVPKVQERLLFLLSNSIGSSRSVTQRLDIGDTRALLDVFDAAGTGRDGKDGVRGKLAVFIADRYLDGEMQNVDETKGQRANNAGDDLGRQGALGKPRGLLLWCKAFGHALELWRHHPPSTPLAREQVQAALAFPPCSS